MCLNWARSPLRILTELHNEKKAINEYLASSVSKYSWKQCTEERKVALLGTTVNNDIIESTLGGHRSQFIVQRLILEVDSLLGKIMD
jgi:hypothetical protein